MKGVCPWLVMLVSFVFSCNELRRDNDSNLNAIRNEAAAEANADKFDGKTRRDARFVYEVVSSDYAGIKIAELANQRSQSPELKQIAQRLIADHTTSLTELKTLAQAKAIALPVEETDPSMRKLERLARESGEDFDKEWCREMVALHERNITKFEERLEDTEDPDLKAFINKNLLVLKQHHQDLKIFSERQKKRNV